MCLLCRVGGYPTAVGQKGLWEFSSSISTYIYILMGSDEEFLGGFGIHGLLLYVSEITDIRGRVSRSFWDT